MKKYLVHCPQKYNSNLVKKDFDNGKIYTKLKDRTYCEENLSDLEIKYVHKFKQNCKHTFPSISSFWHSKNKYLPSLVVASINSYINAGYEFNLYTYKNYKNVPSKVIVRDANEIVPYKNLFSKGNYALFSDYFRIILINKFDTAWSDTDNIFISDDFESKMVFIIQDQRIQNSFFYIDDSIKGRMFKKCLLDFVNNPTKIQQYDSERIIAQKIKCKNINNKMKVLETFDWSTLGSELFTCINKFVDVNQFCYEYKRFFNGFHYTTQYKLYVLPDKPYMHFYNKDVKILILSYNLLYREPWISKNYNPFSYFGNLYHTITCKRINKIKGFLIPFNKKNFVIINKALTIIRKIRHKFSILINKQ